MPEPFDKEYAVQAMFSSIARFYDLNNTLLSLGLHHRWKKTVVRMMAISNGHRVLDVGAGTADLSLLACDQVGADGAVVAVDLNAAMLLVGKEKAERLGRRICFAVGNAQQMPVQSGYFDVALTGFCIRNVSDIDLSLREIYRSLKPGGRFACLEFSHPTHRLFRKLYDFYSFTLLPKIGTWVSKDPTGVYQYLPDSIRRFPDQKEFARRIEAAGFRHLTYRNLSGGIVAIHTGAK